MTVAPSSATDIDRIQVRSPDGAITDVPVAGAQLTIGRGSGADVHLDHERVSRRQCGTRFCLHRFKYNCEMYFDTALASEAGEGV